MFRKISKCAVLDEAVATGVGLTPNVTDASTITFALNTTDSANFTVKIAGSISDECPTFTSAVSAANQYEYIQVIDLEDNAGIDGDTGIASAGTDINRMFEVNVTGLQWFAVVVTAWTAGKITVQAVMFNNN